MVGLRLGINRNWIFRWFFSVCIVLSNIDEDNKIRKFFKKEFYYVGVSEIVIERVVKKLRVMVVVVCLGFIIGKKGVDIEKVKDGLKMFIKKEVFINIKEVKYF